MFARLVVTEVTNIAFNTPRTRSLLSSVKGHAVGQWSVRLSHMQCITRQPLTGLGRKREGSVWLGGGGGLVWFKAGKGYAGG